MFHLHTSSWIKREVVSSCQFASITCQQSSPMMSWQRKPRGIESIANWKSRVVGSSGCIACLWQLAARIRLAEAASVGTGTFCRSC